MVSSRVLSRTKLAYSSRASSLNPRPFSLLQTLCRRDKSQLLCNQVNPNSFHRIPGVGYLCDDLRVLCGLRHRTFIDFQLLPFHHLTDAFFRNFFVFTFICVARGWRGTTPQFLKAKGSTVTCTDEELKIRAIMKLADGPGDRWSRAIGAGGKSGHRRGRLARAGDEDLRASVLR
jgi:hypothetical protein